MSRPMLLLASFPAVSSGMNFAFQRYAVTHGFQPITFIALRVAIGTLPFIVFVLVPRNRPRFSRRDLLIVGGFGGVVFAVNQVTLVLSLRHCSASTAALLFGTLPIFTAVGFHFRGFGRLGRRQWAAAVVSTFGVAIVVLGAHGAVAADGLGLVLALLTPLTFAAYSVCLARQFERYSSMQVNALTSGVAMIPLLALSAVHVRHESWSTLSGLDWAALAYAAAIAYFATMLVLLFLLPRIGAPRVSLFLNLTPFVGAVSGVVFLRESMGWLQVIGGIVIVSAVFVSLRPSRVAPLQSYEDVAHA